MGIRSLCASFVLCVSWLAYVICRMIPPMTRGKVYLIGAGPGDPGLITVRGLACLSMADVVIYDNLVHDRLVAQAPAHAERIDVGTAAPGAMAQEAISYLLVEKAREGRVVARLKWGDPFVFDRGGEEALFLHEHGVPFEVVPGIPAAIGIPAYGGVPVTYPGAGDTLTLVRGHEDESQTAPQRGLGRAGQTQGHHRLLRRAPSNCPRSSTRCCRTDGPRAMPPR